MATPSIYFQYSNGVISKLKPVGEDFEIEDSIAAANTEAQQLSGKDADGNPVNYKVALFSLNIVASIKDRIRYLIPWIDPTELNLNGEDCDSAETFMAWHEAAIQSVNIDTSVFELVANKVQSFESPNATDYASTAAIAAEIQNSIAAANGAKAVRTVSIDPLPFSPIYLNGSGGIGATLTATTPGPFTVYGLTFVEDQRILVAGEADDTHNGIFTLNKQGSVLPPVNYELVRATDFDEVANINNTGVVPVSTYNDADDVTQLNTLWLLASTIETIGTDAFIFVRYTVGSNVVALKTGTLSQFAATTSAQLASVMNDETGSGTGSLLVFSLNPTFKGFTVEDNKHVELGTTTGTKWGTATNQKQGWFGVAPVIQQSGNILTAMQAYGFGTLTLPDLSGTYIVRLTDITGGTKTKVTYDAQGRVTGGADATTADIADSANKRYVTDAQLLVIGNTSGINTGDQSTITGNAGSATKLVTARTINGQSFDGTADITISDGTKVPTSRIITINGSSQDLSVDRTFTITNITGNAATATLASAAVALQTSRSINGIFFNGTADIDMRSVVNTWTAAQRGAFVLLTDAATITIDMALSNNFRVVLGGNRTLGEPTNIVAGQSGLINTWQDGTGSRTLTPDWCFVFPDGIAPTLSTGKYTIDQIAYMVNFYGTSTVTITIANPGVITWAGHGMVSGMKVRFTTTSAMPTGIVAATTYWVFVIDANTFKLSTSLANLQAGTFITTTGSQSGVHTCRSASITISKNTLS